MNDPAPSHPVLVLEDNLVIAMDIEGMLADLGVSECLVANSVDAALRIIEGKSLAFALLDIELGGETSEAVATVLRDRGTPFIFATGYGAASPVAASFPGVPLLSKPFLPTELKAALEKMYGAA